jgi:hypothetical protein
LQLFLPEAREDLIRQGIIELVSVEILAVPDPGRPDDRLEMKISSELYDDFREDIPWIHAELAGIRKVCEAAEEDCSIDLKDSLLVALNRRRKELDFIRETWYGRNPPAYMNDPQICALMRPELFDWNPSVTVWCHTWTVAMEDSGKLLVDVDEPLFFEGLDAESRIRMNERIRQVNTRIGRIVERLMA